MKNLIVLIVFLFSTHVNLISQIIEFSRVHIPNNNFKYEFEPSLGLRSVIYLDDAEMLLGVTEYFLMRSFDGGRNWYSTNPILNEVEVIKLKQTNLDEVTLLTFSDGRCKAQRSSDNGFIWETIYEFATGTEVRDFVRLKDGSFLFASNKGVIKVTNGGKEEKFLLPKVKPNVFDLTIVDEKIFYSTDKSFYWTDANFRNAVEVKTISGMTSFQIADNFYSNFFLITNDKLVYVVESVSKITPIDLPVKSYSRVELDNEERIIVYADKIYVSMDKGKTWSFSIQDLTDSFYSKLIGSTVIITDDMDYTGKQQVYYDDFYVSNIQMANLFTINNYASVSAPVQASSHLILGTTIGGLLSSDDSGIIWKEFITSSGSPIPGYYLNRYSDNRYISMPGLSFSDDDGKSWESLATIIHSMPYFYDYHVNTKNMISWNSDSTVIFIYNDFSSFEYIHKELPYKDIFFPQFDSEGNIWVASHNGDLFKYSKSKRSWDLVYSFKEKAYRLFFDDNNKIFVFCSNSIYISSTDHLDFQNYSFNHIAQNEGYFIDFLILEDTLYFSVIKKKSRDYIRKVISLSLIDFLFSEVFTLPRSRDLSMTPFRLITLSYINNYLYIGGNDGLYRSHKRLNKVDHNAHIVKKLSNETVNQQDKDVIQLTAYPNPANNETLIGYKLFERSKVQLTIYNTLGQQVDMLLSENQLPGAYEYRMSGARLSSGIYFAVLAVNDQIYSRKIVLLK
ncbi:MAG: T9SS type A sorting domain-containing protein [Melioribacteraceae bacterium]|nr:MAG: T9SS type A sorting domain-containing protein [Melioribacteraceae bacterium]